MKYVLYKQWQEDIDFPLRIEVYFRSLFFIQFYRENRFECVVDDKDENGRCDLNSEECAIRSHFDFGREMYLQGASMHRAEPELRHVMELAPGRTYCSRSDAG
ncbi:MAG: hypothetical protein GX640_10465 [Fibrobacter sp.]|nr:hypothetical protein [Fibrobacter sp.]